MPLIDDGFEALLEPFYNGKKLTDPVSAKEDKFQLLPAFLKVKGKYLSCMKLPSTPLKIPLSYKSWFGLLISAHEFQRLEHDCRNMTDVIAFKPLGLVKQ